VPTDGPLIFVGNHQNQFVDALLLITKAPRKPGFMIAASSMKRAIVGWFARAVNSIPVTRPKDVAKAGVGTIEVSGVKVTGTGTQFLKQVNVGDAICPTKPKNDKNYKGSFKPIRVVEVLSDTEIVIKGTWDTEMANFAFKVYPKLDHSKTFEEVCNRLKEGHCVGIFPEGGSHDRPELLPFKAGVSRIAFDAAVNYNTNVRIVPVGLTYFKGHKFRGRVVVEFGTPLSIPPHLLDLYKTGVSANKYKAGDEFLSSIKEGLEKVTVNMPDFESFEVVHILRRLYQPVNYVLSPKEFMALRRRLSEGWKRFNDKPEFQEPIKEIRDYISKLKRYGLTDHHVAYPEIGIFTFMKLTVTRFILVVLAAILSFPSILINAPAGLIVRYLSKKKQIEALNKSTVKIKGLDVLASQKLVIGLVVVPSLYALYTVIIMYFYGFFVGVGFFCSLPFVSYFGVRAFEEGSFVLKTMSTLLTLNTAWRIMSELRETRSHLRHLVLEVMTKMFKEMDYKDRIISEEYQTDEPEEVALTKKYSYKAASPEQTLKTKVSGTTSNGVDHKLKAYDPPPEKKLTTLWHKIWDLVDFKI